MIISAWLSQLCSVVESSTFNDGVIQLKEPLKY